MSGMVQNTFFNEWASEESGKCLSTPDQSSEAAQTCPPLDPRELRQAPPDTDQMGLGRPRMGLGRPLRAVRPPCHYSSDLGGWVAPGARDPDGAGRPDGSVRPGRQL
jgi:hypothetical protein